MNLEHRISTALKDAGLRIDTAQSASTEAGLPRPRKRNGTSVFAFVAGFAVVALFGLVAVLTFGGTNTDSLRDDPIPLASSETGVLEWTAVDALPDDLVVVAIANGSNGWVALASRFADVTAGEYVALQSTDGVSWTRLDGTSIPGAVHLDGLVGSDDGYLAYGLYAGESSTATTTNRPSSFPEPALWTSTDGATWELYPLPLPPPEAAISDTVSYRVFHVAAGNGQNVAVGVEFDEDLPEAEGAHVVPTRPIMWESTGPGEWRLVDSPGLEEWTGLAHGPAGIVASGGSESQTRIMGWAGEMWEEYASLPGNGLATELVGNEHGYLLGTSSGLLFSTDARTWRAIHEGMSAAVIAAHPSGFVVIDVEQGTDVWWSPEGTTWILVGTENDLTIIPSLFIGAAATDNSVIVYGHSQGDGRGFFDGDVRGFLYIGTAAD